MFNKTFCIALFLCLWIMGCESPEERKRADDAEKVAYLKSLTYFKDERTKLCFAGIGLGWNYAVLTYVPCTPEVEKLAVSF